MTFGRVTNNIIQRSTTRDINNNNSDLLAIQKKLSSGREINSISDDPLSVNRVLDFDVTISENQQFLKNIDTGISQLGISDNTLDNLHALIIRSKELVLGQLNGTASEETRKASSIEVTQILKQIVNISNAQIGDNFLFAGSNNTERPFELIGNEVVYHGDEKDRSTLVSKNTIAATNIPGSRAFGVFQNKQESSFDLNPSLQEGLSFSTTTSLQGVPQGFSFILNDVPPQDLIGKELIVISGQNQGVSTRVLNYDAATNAVTVESSSFPATLTEGSEISFIQAATKLDDINNGDGITKEKFLISVGNQTTTIDLENAHDISDVIEQLSQALGTNATVKLSQDKLGISIVNLSSETITIKEDGLNTVGRELGIIRTSTIQTIAAGETFSGNTISPSVIETTALASLNGGAGFNSLGFRIKNGDGEHIFDPDDLERISTVGELVNMINNTSLNIEAGINDDGTGISIRSRTSGKGLFIDDVIASGTIDNILPNNQIEVPASQFKSNPEDFIGTQIIFKNEDGSSVTKEIIDFNGTTLTLNDNSKIDDAATYTIYSSKRFLGQVDSATNTSITDTGNFVNSEKILPGSLVTITNGTGSGNTFRVTSSNDDTIFFHNPNGIALDSTSTYEILSGTAQSLGINTFNEGSKISNLNESSNPDFKTFEITYGADQLTKVVDVSQAKTMLDVINAIESATNFDVRASLVNGNAIKLEDSTSSTTLSNKISVNEIDSGTTAGSLGIAGLTAEVGEEFIGGDLQPRSKESNIFTALFDLINGLQTNSLSKLNNAGKALDQSLSIILDARSEVGARLNRFDLTKNRLEDQQLFVQELRSQSIDADYIDLVFQFNNKRDIIEANLRAIGNILNISLLDFI
ncbi:MAG: flagellar hook-associated protein 3 [Planctomycetota bacterium]|nr:MAG: flagellar hook-associated protein 3 [Planctomycetota bacterium]